MNRQPNILVLMTDQMQGRVLERGHPCQTPCLDRLAGRGVRFERAYTPNAICSPARASLMTGRLPHNHGVLWVTHNVDADQGLMRQECTHWAEHLVKAGYRTGYFGKWHVERTGRPADFGWQVDGSLTSTLYRDQAAAQHVVGQADHRYLLRQDYDQPAGYPTLLHYAVVDTPAQQRPMGVVSELAANFIQKAVTGDEPWCCFVSTPEPHDPFITSEQAYGQYDLDALPIPNNWYDRLTDKPNLYRKQAQLWADRSEQQRREAMACYYACITEIDQQFERLLNLVEAADELNNTIVLVTSDHGELLGAHGLYCKNVSAFEEVYQIPMIMAGPGIACGAVSKARVGLQDVAPTLLELLGIETDNVPDSQSFASVLTDPRAHDHQFSRGYAEYFGGRYMLTQRIVWDGDWKYVHNGFDYDELYNLSDDPGEIHNLAHEPDCRGRLEQIARLMWERIKATNDESLLNTKYPPLRMAPVGPLA